MKRLIILSDFTESFAHKLLKGIIEYSKGREPWAVCRMPPSYKEKEGIQGVIEWALKWNADAIIGQFSQDDDISLFRKNGIIALAQDYEIRFDSIPNITSEYFLTGSIAADFFLGRGFRNFAFFGYANSVWSHERGEGFRERIVNAGYGNSFHIWEKQSLKSIWHYDHEQISDWLRTLPLPLALFACDDTQANKILETCRIMKLSVPNDIAVLGVDNDEITCSLSYPSLSSIGLNIVKAGYDCAELIDRMKESPEYEFHDVVISPSSIITRQSTDVYSTDDPYTRTAISFIHDNIYRNINVEDVLAEVPISRRLLENRFRRVTNTSIYQYIKKMRIEKFAELLIESDEPISAIANRLDYPEHKNMSRIFKSVKGCTPEEFRMKRKIR